jgi:hypothetical protein
MRNGRLYGRPRGLRAWDGRRQAGHHWLLRVYMPDMIMHGLVPAEEASGTNPGSM